MTATDDLLALLPSLGEIVPAEIAAQPGATPGAIAAYEYTRQILELLNATDVELAADIAALVLTGTINPVGAWDSGTAYNVLDLVTYSSAAWIAKSATTPGDTPGVSPKWLSLGTTIDATARADIAALSDIAVTDSSTEGSVAFAGAGWFQTADTAVLDITGDLDVRWYGKLTDWTPAAAMTLIGKHRTNSTTHGWYFRISSTSTGKPALVWSADGTNDTTATASVAPTVSDGQYLWLRATLDVDDGAGHYVVKFYTSSDGVSWTQLGTTVTGGATTSIWANSEPLAIGAVNVATTPTLQLTGSCKYAEVRSGIGGTVVAAPDFRNGAYAPDTAGRTWTSGGTNTVTAPVRTYVDNIGSYAVETQTAAVARAAATLASAAALPRVAYSNTPGYLTLNGSGWMQAPASTGLDITGDIDVRAKITATDWTPAAEQVIASKFRSATGAKSWRFRLNSSSTGRLGFVWSADGTNDIAANSTAAPTISDGQTLWVRATLDVDNGASGYSVCFYTSPDGVTWTQLGSTVTVAGVTSIHTSTEPLALGAVSTTTTAASMFTGTIHYVEVRNGIDGTVVASPDFIGGIYAPDNHGVQWVTGGTATVTAAVRAHTDDLGTYTPTSLAAIQAYVDDAIDDLATDIGGPLTVTKGGEVFSVSCALGSSTLVQSTTRNGSSNGAFTFGNVTLDGTLVHAPGDDITPIRTQLGTVGANHGYTCIDQYTVAGHDKTTADLGSTWTDGTSTYTLLAISGNVLTFGRPYTVDGGGLTQVTAVAPAATLTHVSGATHTTSVAITSPVATPQLYPSIRAISVTYWLDGVQITADGSYHGRTLEVRESYEVLSYKAIVDWAQAHVGQSFAANVASIAGIARIGNSYRYREQGRCDTSHSLLALGAVQFINCGFLQCFPMAKSGCTVTRYMPGVAPMSGFDFQAGVPLATLNVSLIVNDVDLLDPTKPPDHFTDWLLDGSSARVLGFAMGYVADKTDASDAARLANAADQYWDLRDTTKSYPRALYNVTAAAGDRWTVQGYRHYLSPAAVGAATTATHVDDAAGSLVVVDFNQAATGYAVPIPDQFGRAIAVYDTNGVTSLNDVADTEGAVVTCSGTYGAALLRVG